MLFSKPYVIEVEKEIVSDNLGSDYANPQVSRIGRYATSGAAYLGNVNDVPPNAARYYTILATSTDNKRIYAEICNPSNVGGAYLGFGITPTSTQNAIVGRYLAPRTCYSMIPGENLYTGAVYAVASTTESNTLQLTIYEASF